MTSSVFEAIVRLHESLDAAQVIATALESLPAIVCAESWAVYLKSEQAERLELARAVNAAAFPVAPVLDFQSASDPISRAAARHSTILGDSLSDLSHSQPRPEQTARALLCVPLNVGQRLVGAMAAMRAGQPSGEAGKWFGAEEVKLVELFGKALAQALANAIDYNNAANLCFIDDLTRLYNVRYLYQMLDNEIRRAQRYGSLVSIVFMDLDGFKLVNDAYGHRAGSATLTEVAQVLSATVRETDCIARYGGDEFILMLPETSASQAMQVAERVRAHISEHRFSGGVGASIHLTASFGVAGFPEHATRAEQLIELADAAMYRAKQRNKNCVYLAAS